MSSSANERGSEDDDGRVGPPGLAGTQTPDRSCRLKAAFPIPADYDIAVANGCPSSSASQARRKVAAFHDWPAMPIAFPLSP